VAPILQVTHYTYSATGASFTYNIINTPKTSTGVAPSSSVTFNVFPLGYTQSTTIVGPYTYYGAGVNGGVAEFAAGATLNFGPQAFGGTPGSVIQEGTGTTILSGKNTYTGNTLVNGGTLLVNGSVAGRTTVNTGGTLGGSGTTQGVTVQSGGTMIPGSSATQPAILRAGKLTLNSGSSFDVALNSTTAGSGYSQLIVGGTVSLGGSTLNVTLGFTPAIGDSFTIIKNNSGSAVIGTFNGLAEGATFLVKGLTFKITYKGGSGNDVVISRVS
jgi:autotransporter-associated beta strand protein